MPKIAIITGKVTPYRVPVFEKLSRMTDVTLRVMFCARREPNRLWELPSLGFDHVFLREHYLSLGGRYIHTNPDVPRELRRFAPDVVVTTGFNPTHLLAFAWAKAKGAAHVPMTDGTDVSERSLGRLHRAVRRFVYARSSAFVSSCAGGERLYATYGIPASHCFRSCLCIDNDVFAPQEQDAHKSFDLLFCGRIEEVKQPLFALDVAQQTAQRLGRRVSILFVGSGSDEARVKDAAAERSAHVDAHFHGFASQQELPALYRSARLFLFPTLWDPWGVVVNEACAAGLPVLCSVHGGAANELVRHGENGYVLALDLAAWVDKAEMLLTQPALYESCSLRSLALAAEYTHDKAAEGLARACRHSLSQSPASGTRKLA